MRWTRKDNADDGDVEHEQTDHGSDRRADEPRRVDALNDEPGDVPIAENSSAATLLIDSDDVPQVAVTGGGVVVDSAVTVVETDAEDGRHTDHPAVADVDLESERRQLIDLLIYAWDRARSPGVWERLTEGLAAVGVAVLRPDGEPFDAAMHEVGGVESTDDEKRIDTVAETEVAGFADRGRVIREPVVVVFRRSMGSSSIPP